MIRVTLTELSERLPRLLAEHHKLGAAAPPVEIVDDLDSPVAILIAKDLMDALLALVDLAGLTGELELAQLSAKSDAEAVERIKRELGWSDE